MAHVKAAGQSRGERRIERVRTALRRAAFEALYGPFAWAYDRVSGMFFLGQWRRWQRAALLFLRGRRILELGMGTGDLQLDLLRAGYDAFGIDQSMPMLRQAMAKWVASRRSSVASGQVEGVVDIRQGFHVGGGPAQASAPHISCGGGGRMRVCRARAQALPFPDSCFDSVVSTFPSDYIVEERTLIEVRRVLRPGGRLVVVPAGWLNPTGVRGRLFEAVSRLVYGGGRIEHAPGRPDRPVRRHPQGRMEHTVKLRLEQSTWAGALRTRLCAAGFEVSTHIASNERGAALVVVADLAGKAEQGGG